jgi:flagellar L-ring protein precursor FlgH
VNAPASSGTLARSTAMGWLGRFFNSAAFPY